MQVTRKVSEIIHRGVTAVAMTVAIATISGAMATEGQIGYGDVFKQQIQTAFELHGFDVHIAQNKQKSQESLNTLLVSSHDNGYSNR